MRTRLILGPLVCLLAFTACSDSGTGTPDEIVGVVTKVESSGLTQVEGFTVRAEGGNELYEIKVDDDTNFAFPPAHLNEHRVSGEPVAVEVDNRSGSLFATTIDDG